MRRRAGPLSRRRNSNPSFIFSQMRGTPTMKVGAISRTLRFTASMDSAKFTVPPATSSMAIE